MVHPSAKFLRRVWQGHKRPQGEASYAFLPFFDDEHLFTETQARYPAKPNEIVLPHGNVDTYFSPCLFRRKRRRTEYALPSRWLFADLDESDPRLLRALPPTVAWETSRGRYQALWLLEEALSGDDFLELNQKVTYFTGADKGGWSSTKVLRIPGSVSTKHGDDWKVRLLWWNDDEVHRVSRIQKLTAKTKTPRTRVKEIEGLKLPKAPPDRIVRRFRKKLPGRVHKLLRATEARGDRSERLWQLYGDLLAAGMKPEQVLVVVRPTVWNKYAGQRRELEQLWTEINKAKAARSDSRKKTRASTSRAARSRSTQEQEGSGTIRDRQKKLRSRKLDESSQLFNSNGDQSEEQNKLDAGLESYNDFLDKKLKRPGWMVEGIWSEGAHGVLAGEAKTFKSVISTDLAISVASGTNFLNAFEIPATGPVLLIQEENDPGEFQDRMRRIAFSRGLGSSVNFAEGHEGDEIFFQPNATLPIHVMNNRGFDLTNTDHLTWLSRQCVKHRLALIILDPFYLMTPGIDENSAAQVGPVLKNLLKIKQAHGVGIQLIHHYKKQSIQNPIHGAQRMSGTGVFHRWFESAVYVEKTSDPATVRIMPDHRGHAPGSAIRCTFNLGDLDDNVYDVRVYQGKADKAKLHHRLRDLMEEQEEWTLTELRRAMGLSNSRQIKQMIFDHGYVMQKRKGDGPGRPSIIVRKMTEQGEKSMTTQDRRWLKKEMRDAGVGGY